MKIAEKVMYITYIMCLIINGYEAIVQKDGNKIMICYWIIHSIIMFILYRQTDKMCDKQIAWRDDMIKGFIEDRIKKIKEEEGNDNSEN